jgi:hypothetical protein
MADKALINSMLGELELTTSNFLADVINQSHDMTLYLSPPSAR